ncbi:hypothetical protein BD309DRAFT_410819 [Dichomitus squalens]|nr:hypothetical protein BD309DRAFT_410819 [Dichomitus squalens]
MTHRLLCMLRGLALPPPPSSIRTRSRGRHLQAASCLTTAVIICADSIAQYRLTTQRTMRSHGMAHPHRLSSRHTPPSGSCAFPWSCTLIPHLPLDRRRPPPHARISSSLELACAQQAHNSLCGRRLLEFSLLLAMRTRSRMCLSGAAHNILPFFPSEHTGPGRLNLGGANGASRAPPLHTPRSNHMLLVPSTPEPASSAFPASPTTLVQTCVYVSRRRCLPIFVQYVTGPPSPPSHTPTISRSDLDLLRRRPLTLIFAARGGVCG